MTSELIIDGTNLSWQNFTDRLFALACDPDGENACGNVRAPRGCVSEARRLIRHLELADRVTLMPEDAARAEPARVPTRSAQRGLVAALLAIAGPFGMHPRPLHD